MGKTRSDAPPGEDVPYPRWTAAQLARRVLEYSGYIGCGCGEDKHNARSKGCARADFVRLAQELCRKAAA